MSEGSGSGTTVAAAADVHGFFRERLEAARSRQRVDIQPETTLYLVQLLVDFLQSDQLFVKEPDGRVGQEPLAFMLKKAVEAPREERARHLRRMGDTALYVSGFFSDSLSRKLVDVDYYAAMGGRAYDALSGLRRDRTAGVFQELAEKFLLVVDLFSEISERAAVTSNAGILRLYERYVRTGSDRLRTLLADKGVVAMPKPVVLQ
jgi:hypothetical protein